MYRLPPERVWVSVYEEDDEAYALWRDVVGVPPERIKRMGAADNFWASGPTGGLQLPGQATQQQAWPVSPQPLQQLPQQQGAAHCLMQCWDQSVVKGTLLHHMLGSSSLMLYAFARQLASRWLRPWLIGMLCLYAFHVLIEHRNQQLQLAAQMVLSHLITSSLPQQLLFSMLHRTLWPLLRAVL